ncbi:acylphosphatase [Nannocystaceae bacterium ST9]
MASERVQAQVRGIVQGVGYRAATAVQARALGLHGWVRNREDGSVELIAEGSREQLDALIEWCRVGPRMAEVDAVDVAWSSATDEFLGFEVVRG